MSILDDDVFEQAEHSIIVNLLKNVSDEDIPALLQAWYDIFRETIVIHEAKGYEVYPILCLYEECFANRTYRYVYKSIPTSKSKVISICKPSNRTQYINEWKQFMLSHIEDTIQDYTPILDDLCIALMGVFHSKDLHNGDFREPYNVLEIDTPTQTEVITIPSPGHEHKYELFKRYIYKLLTR